MTSSTKPEVHNVSQRRQRKTDTRPQATCTKKFGEVQTCTVGFRVMRVDIFIANVQKVFGFEEKYMYSNLFYFRLEIGSVLAPPP